MPAQLPAAGASSPPRADSPGPPCQTAAIRERTSSSSIGRAFVCPYRHVSLYVDLTQEETLEFTALTKAAIEAIDSASAPHGYNIGMNQGAVAGAGVQAHLHQHVVPRWGGDANFLPIIGQTKALPMLLEDVRSRIAAAWPGGAGAAGGEAPRGGADAPAAGS